MSSADRMAYYLDLSDKCGEASVLVRGIKGNVETLAVTITTRIGDGGLEPGETPSDGYYTTTVDGVQNVRLGLSRLVGMLENVAAELDSKQSTYQKWGTPNDRN